MVGDRIIETPPLSVHTGRHDLVVLALHSRRCEVMVSRDIGDESVRRPPSRPAANSPTPAPILQITLVRPSIPDPCNAKLASSHDALMSPSREIWGREGRRGWGRAAQCEWGDAGH